MIKLIARSCFLVLALIATATGYAQDRSVEMADTMRSNGKIYVVVAVCLTILIGLFLYMVRIDRKVSRLEKNN